ncbi:c-type cytochrome [Prosthecomicrobium hirschii]|uniref:c-type cytochrome n=1 Tax=Prosthecodimorpha hirschii TaxID=665126 RepID=UPI000AA474E5|nr:cytochrome c [Prosthecomicrobium hirschii]MCW1843541.1 cytochrome c [Prosthecomicrobium hirschii]
MITSKTLAVSLTALAVAWIGTTASQAAGDAAAGRKKAAQSCAACHGIDGLAKLPNAANLAGESVYYLDRQLKAFRSGDRKDENMSVVAKALSDADIADLVAWYSSIEVTVTLPKK